MHYQAAPHEESKTLWCTHGSVFDVLVDLRPDEPTYGGWLSVDLAAERPSPSTSRRGSLTDTRRSRTTAL